MIDSRYSTIKGLLDAGAIKKFTEIFEWIPHSTVAQDFKTSNRRMKEMTNDPGRWKIEEIWELADLIGYDKKKLALMALKESQEKEDPGA
jgi:hypothetical protein